MSTTENNNQAGTPTGNNDSAKPKKRTVGMPTPDVEARHREKAISAGTRRHQGIIKLRDTGDENFMTVVKNQHERRKLLDDEAKKGLPEDQIYDPKKVIDSREYFKDEQPINKVVRRRQTI